MHFSFVLLDDNAFVFADSWLIWLFDRVVAVLFLKIVLQKTIHYSLLLLLTIEHRLHPALPLRCIHSSSVFLSNDPTTLIFQLHGMPPAVLGFTQIKRVSLVQVVSMNDADW